jgi:ABC-type glycerol-3-phosphate transport system permease component
VTVVSSDEPGGANRAVRRIIDVLPYALALVWTLVTILPIIWMYVSSLKTLPEYNVNPWLPPANPTIDNYVDAWSGQTPIGDQRGASEIPLPFATYFRNSLIVTGGSIVLTMTIATLGGYALARLRVIGRRVVFGAMLFGLVIPTNALVLPVWLAEDKLHLTHTHLGLILAYVGTTIPFALLLMTSYFQSFPADVEDSARVDGCSELGMLWRIVVPMSRGPLVVVAILLANGFWNEFLYALILTGTNESKTLAVGLAAFAGGHFTPYTVILAAMGISTAPVLILYLIFQRQVTNADIELVR